MGSKYLVYFFFPFVDNILSLCFKHIISCQHCIWKSEKKPCKCYMLNSLLIVIYIIKCGHISKVSNILHPTFKECEGLKKCLLNKWFENWVHGEGILDTLINWWAKWVLTRAIM